MEELNTFLENNKEWNFIASEKSADNHEKLIRVYPMSTFLAGLDFVNDIASVAEEIGHHPDIQLSYGQVVVELWTHDTDEVTKKDIALAMQIEEMYSYV